ncbi:MAG: 23S rRNA (pseudouridine(1915)-N(3))-methyltransferase RlmH [Xanthomonadales bacterium]|nr:23S rRNA (pseudouridine(1915)-N(3))-methyltransferase RlmH [Xanthomonadales bacterium]
MQLLVAAVGQRMPRWVNEAWSEYSRRMPRELSLSLREIALAKRGKNADTRRLMATESDALLAAMPARSRVIALDVRGKAWSTEQLAVNLEGWMGEGRDVGFMIGGPDGISPEILASSDARWSLGPLTLPHPLVRVVLAEQLYRAWTITQNHPYHRA